MHQLRSRALNGWHTVSAEDTSYTSHKSQDILSCQEVCTDPCDTWPCIDVLRDKVMVVDERYNNEPRDLITVSLCIQVCHWWNVLGYSRLCLGYARPYRIGTTAKGHSAYQKNADSHDDSQTACHLVNAAGFRITVQIRVARALTTDHKPQCPKVTSTERTPRRKAPVPSQNANLCTTLPPWSWLL